MGSPLISVSVLSILTLATLRACGLPLCWLRLPVTCLWSPVYCLVSWMTLTFSKEDESVITYQCDFNVYLYEDSFRLSEFAGLGSEACKGEWGFGGNRVKMSSSAPA